VLLSNLGSKKLTQVPPITEKLGNPEIKKERETNHYVSFKKNKWISPCKAFGSPF
jgi:hypothetical protein